MPELPKISVPTFSDEYFELSMPAIEVSVQVKVADNDIFLEYNSPRSSEIYELIEASDKPAVQIVSEHVDGRPIDDVTEIDKGNCGGLSVET